MAISGVSLLKDALIFVTSRALLMKKHWRGDCGSMVSIQASVEKATQIIDSTLRDDGPLDNACYNSQESQVVSGSEASIARLVGSLSSGIRYKELNASYGFHSRLCDSLLEDFDGDRSISDLPSTKSSYRKLYQRRLRHHSFSQTRPAYERASFFHSAVQRLAKELGRCVWLEAGVGSSIISMVKRATSNPADHHFQALTSRPGQNCISQLSEVATELWRQGLSSTHWIFHSPLENALQPLSDSSNFALGSGPRG